MGSAVLFQHIGSKAKLGVFALVSLAVLTGCDETGQFNLGQAFKGNGTDAAPQRSGSTTKTTERDVEAPDVFSATEAGLWDGRPSLGGVWVAHPDVKDPERVIIRNTTNNKFVVGALFRRERDIPGPRLQISSDAAEALGMLAGAPAQLNVTALRKEEIAVEPAVTDIATTDELAQPADVQETALDPIADAAAAIDAAAPTTPIATPAPAPRPTGSTLDKPFIQIGIFSVEANATRTASQMRTAGLVPTIKRGDSGGKPFWRVLVGPAQNSSERKTLLNKIKGEGFSDAYAVTN
jgi:cell division septation protein DedD